MIPHTNALKWCDDESARVISVRDGKTLLESLTTGVLVFDHELRLSYINNAAEALLSVSARKVLGSPVQKLLAEAPDPLTEVLSRAIAREQPFTEREVVLRNPNGDTVTVDCIITPLRDDETPFGVLLELSNVDRLHQFAREENIATEQNLSSALIRGMAHEVKNPLGGIRGAAQLLERELSSEAHREYTRIIIGECDRLRKLIDRMLLPDRASHRQDVNIHELLEHVRNLVQAEATGIKVKLDYDPSLPALFADRDQLVQAFLNVVRNAVQAVKDGGDIMLRTRAERQLTLSGRRHRLAVRVDIIDSGPGIPADIADKIFYPLVSGRPDGTGLGLSITRTLVQRQGGMIACDSRPGRTAFSIWLPVGNHDEVK